VGQIPLLCGFYGIWLELAGHLSWLNLLEAVPFTYYKTRLARKHQVVWLMFLLSVLWLSEVLFGFG